MILNLSKDSGIKNLVDFVLRAKGKTIDIKICENERTDRQNRSIWLYCTLLSEALNDAGLYLPINFFNSKYQMSWTKSNVMEVLWRPMQRGLFSISSTTKLKTNQVSQIYEEMNRALSEEHGLFVPFPNQNYGELNE